MLNILISNLSHQWIAAHLTINKTERIWKPK